MPTYRQPCTLPPHPLAPGRFSYVPEQFVALPDGRLHSPLNWPRCMYSTVSTLPPLTPELAQMHVQHSQVPSFPGASIAAQEHQPLARRGGTPADAAGERRVQEDRLFQVHCCTAWTPPRISSCVVVPQRCQMPRSG